MRPQWAHRRQEVTKCQYRSHDAEKARRSISTSPAKSTFSRTTASESYRKATRSISSLPLYNAAREAYRLIKTANLIYIHNDADKQNRKELYERAQGYYNSMLDVLDLAYMNVNHEKLPSNVLKEWVKLITDELAQISKIKRSDKAR